MDSRVIFEGPGPFALPTAQQATADGHTSNGVTLTLFCSLGAAAGASLGREPEPISVQMTSAVALELAGRLAQAAARADRLS